MVYEKHGMTKPSYEVAWKQTLSLNNEDMGRHLNQYPAVILNI